MRIRFLGAALLLACGGGGDQNDGGADGGGDGSGGDATNDQIATDSGTDGSTPVIPGADLTFGNGGVVTKNFGTGLGAFVHVARQSDGALVAIGATLESIVLARVDATGQLDTTFGSNGVVQFPWGLVLNGVTGGTTDVAIQPDGKIVAATRVGLTITPTIRSRSVVMRLMPNGSLDTSFAGTGTIFGDPKLSNANNSVVLQSNGGIVVAGTDMRRYDASGTPDTTFGNAGVVTSSYGFSGLARQSNDALIALSALDVARYDAAGKIDSAFGTAGHTKIAGKGAGDWLYAADVQTDGNILVAGTLKLGTATQSNFAVGRLTQAGAVDTTFATSGFYTDGSTNGQTIAFGVATQSDGHVLASGAAFFNNSLHQVARFSSTGVLDATYSGGSGQFSDFGNLVVDPSDQATTVGTTISGFSFTPSIERFGAAGALDSTFGKNGLTTVGAGAGYDRANVVAFQSDGKILVGGTSNGGKAVVTRYGTDGSPDTLSISDNSGALAYVNSLAVQSTGKILVGGFQSFSQSNFAVERYDAAGAIDKTFGTNGVAGAGVAGFSESFALDAAGNILVVGATKPSGGFQYSVARFSPEGALDSTFGTAGVASTAFAPGNVNVGMNLVVQQDGKIVVLGATGASQNSNSAKLVRFSSTGALDTTFGGTGTIDVSTGSPFALAQQSDGKLLVATMGQFGASPLVITRYAADGTLDATFGTAGATTIAVGGNDYYGLIAPMGLAIAPDGKILVGLSSSSDGLVEAALLVRLGSDGKPDTTLGTNGQLSLGTLSTRGSSAIHGMAFDANGKLVLCGRTWTEAGASDFFVLRMSL